MPDPILPLLCTPGSLRQCRHLHSDEPMLRPLKRVLREHLGAPSKVPRDETRSESLSFPSRCRRACLEQSHIVFPYYIIVWIDRDGASDQSVCPLLIAQKLTDID